MNLVLRRWRGRNLRADNTSAIVVMIDPMGPNVCKSIEKMAALADDTRAKGKKFCARTHNKVGYYSFPFIFLDDILFWFRRDACCKWPTGCK